MSTFFIYPLRIFRLITPLFCGILFSGCVTSHQPGNLTDALKRSTGMENRDLILTFPAWTSEPEKFKALEDEARIKGQLKCGQRTYKLTELKSRKYDMKNVSVIAANVECTPVIQVDTQPKPQEQQRLDAERKRQEQERFEIAEADKQLAEDRKRLEALQIAQQAATKIQVPTSSNTQLNVQALVIGNSAYAGSARLRNPANDAKAITQKLRSFGFTVTEVIDANHERLISALSGFSQRAASADVTLLFYAGHGVQISGTNYMLPIDLNMNDIAQAPLKGVSLSLVVEQYLPGKTKLVFLDACRDNPLMQTASRGVSRGLAPINVSQGTLIAYATKDGQVAQDGDGKNSPFTKALLNHLDSPDDIAVVLRRVREQVMKDTGGKQQPWEYGSLTGGALVLSALRTK